MNDFTKAQLQDIAFALDTVYLGNSELRAKVQKMIDGYCEHNRFSPTEALNIPLHCLDCGEKFE